MIQKQKHIILNIEKFEEKLWKKLSNNTGKGKVDPRSSHEDPEGE